MILKTLICYLAPHVALYLRKQRNRIKEYCYFKYTTYLYIAIDAVEYI